MNYLKTVRREARCFNGLSALIGVSACVIFRFLCSFVFPHSVIYGNIQKRVIFEPSARGILHIVAFGLLGLCLTAAIIEYLCTKRGIAFKAITVGALYLLSFVLWYLYFFSVCAFVKSLLFSLFLCIFAAYFLNYMGRISKICGYFSLAFLFYNLYLFLFNILLICF